MARARVHGSSAGAGGQADATATAERLIALMRRMPRGEAIDWRLESMPGAAVAMDPDDLGEVLGNLLDNARKWARGVVCLRIDATAVRGLISIEDDGRAFPKHIANGRWRAGESSMATREDSGLGLAIVKDVLMLRIDPDHRCGPAGRSACILPDRDALTGSLSGRAGSHSSARARARR